MQSNRSYDVVIVGGGVSGLSCACELASCGIDPSKICIVEASNRLGGRTKTMTFHGAYVDHGAAWIHGVEDNAVLQMIERHGFSFYPVTAQNPWMRPWTTILDIYKENSRVDNASAHSSGQYFRQMMNDMVKFHSIDAVDGESFASGVARCFPTTPQGVDETVVSAMLHLVEVWMGASLTDLEFKEQFALDEFDARESSDEEEEEEGNDDDSSESSVSVAYSSGCYGDNFGSHAMICRYETNSNGEQVKVSCGMETVAKCLRKDLSNDVNILFDFPVRNISWSGDGYLISTGSMEQSVTAKIVIPTCSVGVLNSGIIKFEPELPEPKKRALSNFSMGTYKKVMLAFECCWWDPDATFVFLEIRSKEVVAFEQRQVELGLEFSSVTDIPGRFLECDNYFKSKKVTALGVNLVGDNGWTIARRQMSDEEIVSMVVSQFDRLCGHIQGYNRPINSCVTRWEEDEKYQGTYSYWSVRARLSDFSTILEPLEIRNQDKVVGGMIFCGEATDREFQGSVQGAFHSGKRAAHDAQAIIKKI